MTMTLLIAALAAALCTPAAGAEPKPKPRKRKPAAGAPRRPARHRRRPPEAPRPTDPTAVTWPRRLSPGRWTPEAADALERLLEHLGAGSTGYSAAEPPIAALLLDDTALSGSPGEALFAHLVSSAAFSFNEDFWRQLPPHYGAARARAGWLSFKDQPPASWRRDPHYQMYRKAMHAARESLCRAEGPRTCARWQAALLTGLSETEVVGRSTQTVADALSRPVAEVPVGETPEDTKPASSRPALRVVPEMLELARRLLERGFDVWLVSRSDQYSAQAAARLFGVHLARGPGDHATRVIGLRQKVDGDSGRLSHEVLQPVPVGSGLAEAAALFFGRPPLLVVGRPEDAALLDYDDGAGLRILLAEPGDAPSDAARRGWLVQTPFSPVRGPQEPLYPPPPGAAPAPSGP